MKDTPGQFESGSSGNHGYVPRKKMFQIQSYLTSVDFLHTPTVLPLGVGMNLKLTGNSDAFNILSWDSIDLAVKIHSLNLLVYRMQPSVALVRLHEKLFSSKMLCFPSPNQCAENTPFLQDLAQLIHRILYMERYPRKLS